MKLQQLRYFCAVIQTRSVTVAARQLGVSQPALSTALKALEEELGGALIQGGRGDMRPTTQGESFHAKALRILKDCETAKIEFKRGQGRRLVKLGVLSTIPMRSLIAFQQRLARSLPDIELAMREGSTHELIGALAEGRIDASVMALNMAGNSGWVPISNEALVLACRSDDPLAAAASVEVKQLNSRAFIQRSHCELSHEGYSILDARGVRMNVVLRTNQDQRAMEAVQAMMGVTIAPLSLIAGLAAVPLEDFGLTRTLGIRFSKRVAQPLRDDMAAALTTAIAETLIVTPSISVSHREAGAR
ncbi:LysR family transcriptional regulator [Tardiphaga alba]|uniref:LysR family transcriptional regulator n=1 Tax=Tardiphaga alba TaxID=340268 RepID=A0ABX8AH16_9BRAD|nr:LysR family transcriptional regulator [Tardiphaga alba]QUS41610.1 LysR family transcriptional regulator [Tardiphaga alba]